MPLAVGVDAGVTPLVGVGSDGVAELGDGSANGEGVVEGGGGGGGLLTLPPARPGGGGLALKSNLELDNTGACV